MHINEEFTHGDIVYIKTDKEQCPYIIIEIRVRPNNQLIYLISDHIDQRVFYGFELSKEKNIVFTLT